MTLSLRVLTLLQFTRAALVFTALADFLASALIARSAGSAVHAGWATLTVGLLGSASLYGFGMALNDLVDRRRDALLAASRPLPSGRLGLTSAHLIVAALGIAGLGSGLVFALRVEDWGSAVLVLLTLGLIALYNFAAKYLVSAGLIALGLIRLTHAAIAAPDLPVVWHPLWLFTHVTVVASVAYVWEEKRPRMTPLHSAVVAGSVAAVNVAVVTAVLARKLPRLPGEISPVDAVLEVLQFWPTSRPVGGDDVLPGGLLWPILASFMFAAVAWRIGLGIGDRRTRAADGLELAPSLREQRRRAGRQLIVAGLLWLIVYDAAFVLGYVGRRQALGVLVLLPMAYAAVRLMRLASQVTQARQSMTFILPAPPMNQGNPDDPRR